MIDKEKDKGQSPPGVPPGAQKDRSGHAPRPRTHAHARGRPRATSSADAPPTTPGVSALPVNVESEDDAAPAARQTSPARRKPPATPKIAPTRGKRGGKHGGQASEPASRPRRSTRPRPTTPPTTPEDDTAPNSPLSSGLETERSATAAAETVQDGDAAALGEPGEPLPPAEGDVPEHATDFSDDTRSPAAADEPADDAASDSTTRGRGRRARDGGPHSNALGLLIERRFADRDSPVRSYSELERRSGISREALSRYVTPRADRRRSPTIDTLAAIANALHLSIEQIARAAVAGARGVLPPDTVREARAEQVAHLAAALTADQFGAVVELLRQMQPDAGSQR